MFNILLHKAVDVLGISRKASASTSASVQDCDTDGEFGEVHQTAVFFDLPIELMEMVFTNFSPRDLSIVRQVCTAFNDLASEDRVWSAAKVNLLQLPKPDTWNGEPLSEWRWAAHVFTMEIRKKHSVDVPAYGNWVEVYEPAWKAADAENKDKIAKFVQWDAKREGKVLTKKDITHRTRLYMRMPACVVLFDAFRRDLEVIDYTSWTLALPYILQQANLVGAGDITELPEGFMLAESDMVVCPACAAESGDSAKSTTSKPQAVKRADNARPWRWEGSRIRVKGLYDHYVLKHADLAPPTIPSLFIGCELCPLKSQTYSGPGILAHIRCVHGVVNPST
ncbi:hypothetical protein EV122DRAFT_223966 [Schizophyllum commune]